jgi:hypothetical protein
MFLIVAGLVVAGLVAFFALSSLTGTEARWPVIAQVIDPAATATTAPDATIAAEPVAAVTVEASTAAVAIQAPTQTSEAATAEAQAATPEMIESFTSTPMPSTSTPPSATDEDIIFAEYFDSDENGWTTGGFEDEFCLRETTFEEGTYNISIEAKQAEFIHEVVLPKQEFLDFILTLEATPHDSAEHYSYGLVVRKNAAGHTYAFEIGNDGLYGVSLFEGDWVMLKDWSTSDAIRVGQTNTLTVKAKGETLVFLVNEEELTSIEDDTLSKGQVGLVIEVFEEDTSATVTFDNLIVKSAL